MVDLAIDSRILLDRNIDLALQELDILFNTTNTELIGYVDFGTNFEQFLWQMTPSVDELKRYITTKIQNDTLYLREMETEIDVQVDNSEYVSNLYIVTINIKDTVNGSTTTRIYKLK